MIDEPLPVEHPVHTLPPVRIFQQDLILSERHVFDELKSRSAYCPAHFLDAKDRLDALPDSPLDLAELVERFGEIVELAGEIRISYDATYVVVLITDENESGGIDHAELIEQFLIGVHDLGEPVDCAAQVHAGVRDPGLGYPLPAHCTLQL